MTFFVSPYDRFRLKQQNVIYLAPFSDDWPGNKNLQLQQLLHRSRDPLLGSLRAQILLAIFLGFDDINLVGHDYTLFPTKSGHFYENEVIDLVDLSEWNKDFLEEVSRVVEIATMGIGSSSRVLPYKEISIRSSMGRK